MALAKVELGGGRVAYIREEITVGQAEDFTFLVTHWIGDDAGKELRGAIVYAIVFVERFDGFDGLDWPKLDEVSVDVDSPEVAARYKATRRNLSLAMLKSIMNEVDKRMSPSEKLEGN